MMSLENVSVRLVRQIYPTDNRSIFQCIKLNSTTRISEMLVPYKKRITRSKNKAIESRIYTTLKCRYTKNENRFCPMKYTKVLCHGCCEEIGIHNLYLSKNGWHGRSKFYHAACADLKNVI